MKRLQVLVMLLIAVSTFAENRYQERYLELLGANRLDELPVLFDEWEKAVPRDIEREIARFNYYARKGYSDTPTMGKMPDGTYGMYPDVRFDPVLADQAVTSLDAALAIDPKRIDVHIGKCQFLAMARRYQALAAAVNTLLETYRAGDQGWTWKNGVSLASASKKLDVMIVDAINAALGQIREVPAAQDARFDISRREYETFPQNVIAINHYATALVDRKDFAQGIRLLETAHELVPGDEIVTANLAYSCELAGQSDRARTLFQELAKSNNPGVQNFASRGLQRLGAPAP